MATIPTKMEIGFQEGVKETIEQFGATVAKACATLERFRTLLDEMKELTLDELPNGALFETVEPLHGVRVRAVKSEYRYPDGGAPLCVLLASGEYAHFPDGGATRVRWIDGGE